MNKTEIMNKATRAMHKVGFKLKKHSPEILVVGGVVSMVAGGVFACKATLKVNEVIDETKENIEKIHVATERGYTDAGEDYTLDDSKKDLTLTYVQTGVKLVKLYAPAIAFTGLGIAGILKGHNILNTRNAALAAAYTAVDNSFKKYRKNVVDRFGTELDKELRYNLKQKEVEEVVTTEDGTEEVVKKTVTVGNPKEMSEFAVCFDETCLGWCRDAEYNKKFLLDVQRFANQKLAEDGFLYLNDVYEMIGAQKTKAGQIVGWIYDKDKGGVDGFVDFGIFDLYDEQKRAFANGLEKSVWIDPNVDGNIWELMK